MLSVCKLICTLLRWDVRVSLERCLHADDRRHAHALAGYGLQRQEWRIIDSTELHPAGGLRHGHQEVIVHRLSRYREIIGTSPVSWEEAAKTAVETASKTLRDLRVAEIVKLDMKVENGKAVAFRARVALSFKYEG